MFKIINSGWGGRDPHLSKIKNRFYYCYACDNKIYFQYSIDIETLGVAMPKVIFDGDDCGYREVWAPEFHFVNGIYYVYFTATKSDVLHHRLFFICCEDIDTCSWSDIRPIGNAPNEFSIDQTVFSFRDKLYTAWTNCGNMFLAEMLNPTTIKNDFVVFSKPTFDWEKIMNPINEGPSFFVKNGVLFCVFSASDSKCDDYCIGLLQLRGNNPLDVSCWQKYDKPVFAPTDNAKGIGHCSICLSDEIGYICYHVFKTDSSLGWENVFAVVQDFNFDANGKPIFGSVQYDRNKYLEGKYDFCRR